MVRYRSGGRVWYTAECLALEAVVQRVYLGLAFMKRHTCMCACKKQKKFGVRQTSYRICGWQGKLNGLMENMADLTFHNFTLRKLKMQQ